MDNCCFNRILDDRSYPDIYLECNSVLIILELLYTLCSTEVEITEEIIERALMIQEQSNIRSKDSLHLACAEYANVDVLLTVDRKFRNNANRLPARIEVTSPTEWLVEVLYGKDN